MPYKSLIVCFVFHFHFIFEHFVQICTAMPYRSLSVCLDLISILYLNILFKNNFYCPFQLYKFFQLLSCISLFSVLSYNHGKYIIHV